MAITQMGDPQMAITQVSAGSHSSFFHTEKVASFEAVNSPKVCHFLTTAAIIIDNQRLV